MQITTLLRYLAMPLRGSTIFMIGVFGVLFRLAEAAGLFGIALMIVVVSWFFKYSFVLVDDVINGKGEPPLLSMEMVNPVEQRPLGMLTVMAAIYFLTSKLTPFVGKGAVIAVQLLFLIAVPAMVAAMSMAGRFVDGLNPVAVSAIIARIPLAYAGLLLVIAVIWGVPWLVFSALKVSPPHILAAMLFMYLWLAMMACTGGLIYENRLDLDIDVERSPERTEARANAEQEREYDRQFDTIFAQVRGGAFANAGAEVRRVFEGSLRPLEEFRWMYARAARLPDPKLADYLVQLALPRLLEARANGEALDCVRARLNANQNFRPASGVLALRLAMLARDAGDRSMARTLLQDFEQRFPGDPAAMVAKFRAELSRE